MTAPNPLAARRRTNSSSFSGAVPSSREASVVRGAMTNRFAISFPQLNFSEDQTAISVRSDPALRPRHHARGKSSLRRIAAHDRFALLVAQHGLDVAKALRRE